MSTNYFIKYQPYITSQLTVTSQGYTTYTGKAIEKAITYDMAKRDSEDNTLKIIVLLTDGKSNDNVEEISQEARHNVCCLLFKNIKNEN